MDTIVATGAGLDVPQKFITVAVRCRSETGKLFAEVRTYRTRTRDQGLRIDFVSHCLPKFCEIVFTWPLVANYRCLRIYDCDA